MVLPYAAVLGVALLLATALSRMYRRGVGAVVLSAGLGVSAYLAVRAWQLSPDPFATLGLAALAGLLAAVGVWSVRRPAPLLELAVLALAWYLILRGSLGSGFVASIAGSLALATAVIVTMILTEPRARPRAGQATASGNGEPTTPSP